MNPLISVITATRDRPGELRRAYASLLGQDYDNWEWIVVDDRSREPYLAALAAHDQRIRPLSSAGATGKGPARNLGLAAVRGAWFTFLDDDDELLPRALSVLRAAARDHDDAPNIYRAELLLRDRGARPRPAPIFYQTGDPWIDALFAVGNIAGYLVPGGLSAEVYFRDTPYFQDGDYFLRLACRASVVPVGEAVYVYHRYGASGSANAYAARDPEEVLGEELAALRGLFDADHPTIRAYRRRGVYGLALAARYVWHASAFPAVSLRRTIVAALRASRHPVVWKWLAGAAYLRGEYHWPVLRRLRGG